MTFYFHGMGGDNWYGTVFVSVPVHVRPLSCLFYLFSVTYFKLKLCYFYRNTALHIASQNSHTSVAALLLHNEADNDPAEIRGFTPLTLASMFGHLDIVQLLAQNGSNIDKSTKNG